MKVDFINIKAVSNKLFILFFILIGNNVSAQLIADFTATPITGCAPLTVSFSDKSTGNPTTWKWVLGNGSNTTLQNPTTTYLIAGTYSITLTVTNANGSNIITKTQYITVFEKPIVNFKVRDTSGCSPLNTLFTDLSSTSIGNITSWKWDFNDGGISILQNPTNNFTTAGNYNITLKVTNNGGCSNSLTKVAYIKIYDPIRPNFSFSDPVKCKSPETISFSNTTVGPGTLSYLWNFGDGGNATTTNPTHAYLNGGTYTLKLIVKNNLGCKDSLVLRDTLKLKNVLSQIAGPDTVCLNIAAIFSNTTTPIPFNNQWNFGDGSVANAFTVSKSWSTPGNYNLKLLNRYNSCNDSVIKKVTVLALPIINFSSDDSNSCKAPLTVNFNNLSVNTSSWFWEFGDGGTSTLPNPTHIYNSNGEFDVSLTVSNSSGCNNKLTQYRFIKITKPTVNIDNAEAGGCIPYIFKPSPIYATVDGVASYYWDFGNGITSTDRNPTMIYTNLGNYNIKLIITTNDGCIDSAILINGVKTGTSPIVNFNASPVLQCAGATINFSDLSNPSDRWLWNFGNGQTSTLKNPQFAYADTGKYSVKLTAWNNGCSDTLRKNNFITILVSVSKFNPVFNCINKKQVSLNDSSVMPLTWYWDFGDGSTSVIQNPTHIFAQYQTYQVSLTTTNGNCTNTKTIPITLINEIPDFTISKNALCKTDSILLKTTGINNANIKKYSWIFGDGLSDSSSVSQLYHVYNTAGVFNIKLIIEDNNGCMDSIVKNNIIQVNGPKAGYYINALGGCKNQTVNFIDSSKTINNNNNIVTRFWDFGDGQTQTFTGPFPALIPHIYNANGSYYPFLKIIDSSGCSDSIMKLLPLTISKPIAKFFASYAIVCTTDSVIFRNTSTGNSLNYLWNFGDGTFSTAIFPKKLYPTAGTYTVKLLVTDNNGCKDSFQIFNYIKVADTRASFMVNDSFGYCIPFQVDFTNTSTNATSQSWDFGDGATSSAINPTYYYTSPGIYFVTLTTKRSINCSSTFIKKIEVRAPSAAISYSPLNGCSPLDLIFKITTQDELIYIWDFKDGNILRTTDSIIIHRYNELGKFIPTLLIKDTSGCVIPISGIDTIKLFKSNVNFYATDSLFCDNGIVQFTNSTITSGIIRSYQWDFGDGTVSVMQHPVHQFVALGQYTIKLKAVTIYGCEDSLVKINYIKVVKKPQIQISGTTTFCGSTGVVLQGLLLSIDTSAIFWKWKFHNGSVAQTQNSPTFQYNNPGIYPVQLSVINSSGCTDTSDAQIIINPMPTTFSGNDTVICLNNILQLQASGADFYNWFPATNLSCSNCSNPIANLSNSTTYFVKGSSNQGCEKTDSINIIVKKPFSLSGLQNTAAVCSSTKLQLNVTGAERYQWHPPTGLNNASINNPLVTTTNNIIYKIIGYDDANCFKDSATININVNATPSVNAGVDKTLLLGQSLTLAPNFSTDVTTWLWTPASNLSCSNCPNPVVTPVNNTTYKLTVTNVNGCTASDEVFIQIACNKNNLFLPNAFTPNNTSRNNAFYPITIGSLKIISFRVFDRLGQMVFQNINFFSNDKTAGWDGLFKGKPANTGAYIYTIEMSCTNNQIIKLNGNILLLR